MGDYFPRCAPAQAGVDAARLLELCAELQKPRYGLHALLLLRGGKVFYESYAAPYQKGEKHSLFSVSKSFTAVAILFAVQEGILSLEDRVTGFFPEKLPSPPCPNMAAMTIRHLLTMTPGLDAAPHDFKYPHLDDVINDFPYSYSNFTYDGRIFCIVMWSIRRASAFYTAPPALICFRQSLGRQRGRVCWNFSGRGCWSRWACTRPHGRNALRALKLAAGGFPSVQKAWQNLGSFCCRKDAGKAGSCWEQNIFGK